MNKTSLNKEVKSPILNETIGNALHLLPNLFSEYKKQTRIHRNVLEHKQDYYVNLGSTSTIVIGFQIQFYERIEKVENKLIETIMELILSAAIDYKIETGFDILMEEKNTSILDIINKLKLKNEFNETLRKYISDIRLIRSRNHHLDIVEKNINHILKQLIELDDFLYKNKISYSASLKKITEIDDRARIILGNDQKLLEISSNPIRLTIENIKQSKSIFRKLIKHELGLKIKREKLKLLKDDIKKSARSKLNFYFPGGYLKKFENRLQKYFKNFDYDPYIALAYSLHLVPELIDQKGDIKSRARELEGTISFKIGKYEMKPGYGIIIKMLRILEKHTKLETAIEEIEELIIKQPRVSILDHKFAGMLKEFHTAMRYSENIEQHEIETINLVYRAMFNYLEKSAIKIEKLYLKANNISSAIINYKKLQ